jgi:hypothetical protein
MNILLTLRTIRGAGNWYSPATLGASGQFTSSGEDTSSPTTAQQAPLGSAGEIPTRRAGRGGAGNFVWEDERQEKAKRAPEERDKGIHESAAKNVETLLAKPGKAVLKAKTVKEATDLV